jgi:competence protein ComEA
MLKKIFALIAMLYAAATFAAVDVNKASAADLDGVKGIGPAISSKILEERKKGNFKDWNDFIERVKGVGEGNAAKFSAEGLTVNGAGFKGAAAATAPKKDEKPMAKAEEKKADVKPAAAAPATPAPAAANMPAVKEEKKDPKAEAKAKKEADKKAKAEEKQKKADEAKAKKEAASKAKDDKKDAKAEAAKSAASAAKK